MSQCSSSNVCFTRLIFVLSDNPLWKTVSIISDKRRLKSSKWRLIFPVSSLFNNFSASIICLSLFKKKKIIYKLITRLVSYLHFIARNFRLFYITRWIVSKLASGSHSETIKNKFSSLKISDFIHPSLGNRVYVQTSLFSISFQFITCCSTQNLIQSI